MPIDHRKHIISLIRIDTYKNYTIINYGKSKYPPVLVSHGQVFAFIPIGYYEFIFFFNSEIYSPRALGVAPEAMRRTG